MLSGYPKFRILRLEFRWSFNGNRLSFFSIRNLFVFDDQAILILFTLRKKTILGNLKL